MKEKYRPIALTVDIVIFSRAQGSVQVLLIKRGRPPFEGKWAIPGGFVEYDEELDTAAKRELEEETGIKDVEPIQLYTTGTPGRDPRGRTVSIVYYAFVDADRVELCAGDDAKEAQWFDMDELPELAFDHAKILSYTREKCF